MLHFYITIIINFLQNKNVRFSKTQFSAISVRSVWNNCAISCGRETESFRLRNRIVREKERMDGASESFLRRWGRLPPPYLRRSAIIAWMMGPPSRSEIPNVAMATAAVAILVHSQLSIIGKIRGNLWASGIFYCQQNGVPESPALCQLSRTRRIRRGVWY